MQPMLARAQYAASAAPVLPEDVATQALTPASRMEVANATAKRSLYEPDGLQFSSLNRSLPMPSAGPIARLSTSGVLPSPRDRVLIRPRLPRYACPES